MSTGTLIFGALCFGAGVAIVPIRTMVIKLYVIGRKKLTIWWDGINDKVNKMS